MRASNVSSLWAGVVAWGLVVLAAAAIPRSASAEGFVGPEGHLWVKVGYRSWSADRTFAGPNDRDVSSDTGSGVELGDRIPFDSTTGGEMEMQALEAQATYVPLPRFRVGLYMPAWQQIRFENANFETVTSGTGDVRPHVGYQITPPGGDAATTLHLRAKIPTTELAVEAASVPLSEGQVDLAVDQTTSWRPVEAVQLTLKTLFRYRAPGRLPNSGEPYKPGDETVLELRMGGAPVESLWLEAGYKGLWSTGWELREGGTAGRSEFRMVQNVAVSVYWAWSDLVSAAPDGFAVDVSVVWPWTGRDYPAGPTVAAGLAWGYAPE